MRCGGCGEENPERAKFCLECGTPLDAATAAPSRESRRTVTVVFADMVGFTSLGESLDQESLRRVMDRFYAEMRAAIEAQEGTLAKFIGDAVLAVWGTPHVREDDALRAVRAADAMRRALAGLNEALEQRWGVRVGMRTGVNTGEVVVDPTRPAPAPELGFEARLRRHALAVAARDYETMADMFAADYEWVSHQDGQRDTVTGREAGVQLRRAVMETEGLTELAQDFAVLEMRGDRHGLVRITWRGAFRGGALEVSFLAVAVTDDDGRVVREESFDIEDVERARARLEELAAARS